MTTFVRLDAQRQVVTDGASAAQPLWATWGRHEPEDVHSWPCVSPDGRAWAAVRVARGGGAARVVRSTAAALETETEPLDGIPIYLQWSPGGVGLAVLLQRTDGLELRVVAPDGSVSAPWCAGSPLFFAWLDDARIAAHVGRGAGRTEMVVLTGEEPRPLPGTPATFCAPAPTPGGVVWVSRRDGAASIVRTAPSGLPSKELERVQDGLVALVPTPDGQVLRAISSDANGQTYHDLRRLDPVTGRSVRLVDAPMAAFQPVPDGSVVVVRRDERSGRLAFLRVGADGRDERLLGSLAPTRDLRFWVRFFEQYAPSHPLVDPTSGALMAAGALGDGDEPRVWRWPLDGGPAEDLGAGWFACFAPARRVGAGAAEEGS